MRFLKPLLFSGLILQHRQELAEQGIEKTPGEVREWFDDASELFRAAGLEIPADELVDAVEQLRGELPPLAGDGEPDR